MWMNRFHVSGPTDGYRFAFARDDDDDARFELFPAKRVARIELDGARALEASVRVSRKNARIMINEQKRKKIIKTTDERRR